MNNKGWNIDTSVIENYVESWYNMDIVFETADKLFALFFYDVKEVKMGSYMASVAIYNNHKSSTPIFSSGKSGIWYEGITTFSYLPQSKCFIFKKPAYIQDSKKGEMPFLLVKPINGQFAFIEWDYTSAYFGFIESSFDVVEVIETHPNEIRTMNIIRPMNKIFQLEDLTWHDISKINCCLDIYVNR